MTETNGQKSVEQRRERLRELEAKLEELRAQEEELSETIAEAVADGEEPDELREKRREVRELAEDIESAVPLLREQLREAIKAERRERAAETIQHLKKVKGGIAGRVKTLLEEKEDRKAEYLRFAEDLLTAVYRGRELETVIHGLARRAGLDRPTTADIPGGARSAGVDCVKLYREAKTPRGAVNDTPKKAARHLRSFYEREDMDEVLDLLDELEGPATSDGTEPETDQGGETEPAQAPESETSADGSESPDVEADEADEDREKPPAEVLASPGTLYGGYVDEGVEESVEDS